VRCRGKGEVGVVAIRKGKVGLHAIAFDAKEKRVKAQKAGRLLSARQICGSEITSPADWLAGEQTSVTRI
jgi:hypothetical protein